MLVKLADENVDAARVGSAPVPSSTGMPTSTPIDGDLIGGRVHLSG